MIGFESVQQRDDSLNKMLVASLALHFIVILFFTLRAVFFPSTIPVYHPVVRVDLVGLPDKRNPEIPMAPKEKPQQEKASVESQKNKLHTLKKEESMAFTKLKTMSAIEKLKNMKDTQTDTAKKSAEVVRGNKLSSGDSLRGLDKIDFNEYIGKLNSQVKSHWILPEWMNALDLHAVVLVKLDKTGQVIEKTFTQKSGNADFDTRVMLAIEQATPFPVPPDKLVDLISTQGIEFAFPE